MVASLLLHEAIVSTYFKIIQHKFLTTFITGLHMTFSNLLAGLRLKIIIVSH